MSSSVFVLTDSLSPYHMREFFERIERIHFLSPGTPGHGFDGYLDTNTPGPSAWEDYNDLLTVLETILEKLGGKINVMSDLDVVSPTRDLDEFVFGGTLHVDEKWRRLSSRDYVRETAKVDPLTVKLNTLASKLIFSEDEENKVVGVEYLEGDRVYRANAWNNGTQTETTIVYAGVSNSP